MSEARCPVCTLVLVATDPGQLGCPRCKGTWLSLDAFGDLVHSAGYDPERDLVMTDLPSRTARACPTCGTPMLAGTVLEVLVDRCNDHGLWADAGELSRIVLAVRRRGKV